MSRSRILIISVLGGLALLVILLDAIVVVSRPQWCCGPEIPLYPGATQVQSSVRAIFGKYTDDFRRVRYFTTASGEELRTFYRNEYVAKGYHYNDCCNLRFGDNGLMMITGENGFGDLEVTWTRAAGGQLVDASISAFGAIACDCM